MAERPAQRFRDEPAVFRSGFASAAPRPGLLALTRDAALVDALRSVVDADHPFAVVASDTVLTQHLLASQTRAALIDSAACTQPIALLTGNLKAQFPDLVLVVAGNAADQGALASQITDGRVYRFLHKPVSAQRVKLFVESAFRRSDEVPPTLAPAPAPLRVRSAVAPRTPLVAGSLALAIVAAVAIGWLVRDDPAPPAAGQTTPATAAQATPSPAPSGLDPAFQATLERADAALARGALVAPPGESAVDLYRQVLAKSPDSARAATGLDNVVDRLLGGAEKAIVAEQLDEASRLVDTARAVRPGHPRVAFLTTQIGKERERRLLAAARQAAASGNLERAIAVLESGSASGSELLGAAKRELQQQELASRADALLALAEARVKSGALLEPAQDNARFYLESARALVPQQAGLPAAERALQAALLGAAGSAIAAGEVATAERWIEAGEEIGVARADLANLRRELQSAQIEHKSEALSALGRQFDTRLRQNGLVEPVADSARAIYLQMRAADPQHPTTLAARDALGKAMLAESRAALARADVPGAERWVAEADALGIPGLDVTNAKRDIATQQARASRATSIVPVSQLTRLRMVEPRYPTDARAAGQTGWVDLEFTVTPTGTVSDVRVVGASTAGVFDRAASDALERWRFKPVERNGVAVPQRAKLRIRFDLE